MKHGETVIVIQCTNTHNIISNIFFFVVIATIAINSLPKCIFLAEIRNNTKLTKVNIKLTLCKKYRNSIHTTIFTCNIGIVKMFVATTLIPQIICNHIYKYHDFCVINNILWHLFFTFSLNKHCRLKLFERTQNPNDGKIKSL